MRNSPSPPHQARRERLGLQTYESRECFVINYLLAITISHFISSLCLPLSPSVPLCATVPSVPTVPTMPSSLSFCVYICVYGSCDVDFFLAMMRRNLFKGMVRLGLLIFSFVYFQITPPVSMSLDASNCAFPLFVAEVVTILCNVRMEREVQASALSCTSLSPVRPSLFHISLYLSLSFYLSIYLSPYLSVTTLLGVLFCCPYLCCRLWLACVCDDPHCCLFCVFAAG